MPDQPDLPDHPTCTIRSGERVELRRDDVLMPDGSTRTDLHGCQLESGAVLFFSYEDPPPATKHHAVTVALPDEKSPDDVPDSTDATSVVALPPEPPKLPPESAINPVTAVLAVGAAGAAGSLGLRRLRASTATAHTNAQQKEERRQRAECATRSDSVLLDFRAHVADAKTRRLPHIVEPRELWQRADALEAQVDHLRRILRAMAKTRRA